MIARSHITGIVLAGGRGTRMGGVDKGLQDFRGQPLALHAARRLQPQVAQVLLNANRHLDVYAAFGMPVCADGVADQPGPLAGFLAGLDHCQTDYLATVPCDSPFFPEDLVERLAAALQQEQAEAAVAMARGDDGRWAVQPVFCLLRTRLRDGLAGFIGGGGRKVGQWLGLHATARVPFDRPADDPQAFGNANTQDELQRLARP